MCLLGKLHKYFAAKHERKQKMTGIDKYKEAERRLIEDYEKNKKRELLDSIIQPTFTYLGRCEKLPDRRPDGSKLVNGDVFTLDTKEKCGKDTITISHEYVYTDNGWIELPDIPQPKIEYPSMIERL